MKNIRWGTLLGKDLNAAINDDIEISYLKILIYDFRGWENKILK